MCYNISGFILLVTPIYLSEIAPPYLRGLFTLTFYFYVSLGMVIAFVVNWRLSSS